jgi:hypothetical protein
LVVGSNPTGPAKNRKREESQSMIEPEKKKSDIEQILAVALIIISCFFTFTYFLTVAIGPIAFFSTEKGITASIMHMNGLPVWLFIFILFRIPIMPTVGEVFLFLVGIFFLCLLAAWKFRESFHNVIRKGSSRAVSNLFSNFLVAMSIITSMLLVAVFAIIFLQDFVGLPTKPPQSMAEGSLFEQLFNASYAVPMEEIGFRLSPIGLLLIIRVFVARVRKRIPLSGWGQVKLFFTALIYPDRAKKDVGLKTVSDFGVIGGISRSEWVMIFLTSFAWALAHYLFGWTAGKITSVFVDGLVFGLVYLAYGAYAPILLHWFFNYYFTVLDLSMTHYLYLLPIDALAILLMLAVGIVGWIAFAIIGVKKLLKLGAKQSMPLPPPPPPPDQTPMTMEKDIT